MSYHILKYKLNDEKFFIKKKVFVMCMGCQYITIASNYPKKMFKKSCD